MFLSAQSLVKIIECIKGLKFKYAAQSTLPFTSLKTWWELEPTSVPQLFLGSILGTRQSAIGQFFSPVPDVFAKV